MKSFFKLLLVMVFITSTGCAITPQTPLALNKQALNSTSGRIGVAMTEIPKADTDFPGANCILCLLAARGANKQLTEHTHTLPHDSLPNLPAEIVKLLEAKGSDVLLISEKLNIEKLESHSKKGEGIAQKDFSTFKEKYNISKLLVIEINQLGFVRTYASYFPTSDPKSVLSGKGYIVNLSNNNYEWYLPVNILKSAEGNWDEPKNYPGLTNAYFQAIELGKDAFKSPLKTLNQENTLSNEAAMQPVSVTVEETP